MRRPDELEALRARLSEVAAAALRWLPAEGALTRHEIAFGDALGAAWDALEKFEPIAPTGLHLVACASQSKPEIGTQWPTR